MHKHLKGLKRLSLDNQRFFYFHRLLIQFYRDFNPPSIIFVIGLFLGRILVSP